VAAGDSKKGLWTILAVFGGCGCLAAASFAIVSLAGFGSYFALSPSVAPVPTSTDEDTVRDELEIPDGATLVSLTADPITGGTFGREGLRIVATFRLPPSESAAYEMSRSGMPGWAPLPLPGEASRFPSPPIELPTPTTGLGFCQTGVWASGTTFTPHPCAPPPADFDQYRTAVLDTATGELTAVFKNYY
jgi:hypothetical protein